MSRSFSRMSELPKLCTSCGRNPWKVVIRMDRSSSPLVPRHPRLFPECPSCFESWSVRQSFPDDAVIIADHRKRIPARELAARAVCQFIHDAANATKPASTSEPEEATEMTNEPRKPLSEDLAEQGLSATDLGREEIRREAIAAGWTSEEIAATNPDNAAERMADASLIAELAGQDYVTTSEAAAVVSWVREWARGTFEDFDTMGELDNTIVIRSCNQLIDGGLAFVLADVRRLNREGVDTNDPAVARELGSPQLIPAPTVAVPGDDNWIEADSVQTEDEREAMSERHIAHLGRVEASGSSETPREESTQVIALRDGASALRYRAERLNSLRHAGYEEAARMVTSFLDNARELELMADKLDTAQWADQRGHDVTWMTAQERNELDNANVTPMLKPDQDDYSGFAR